MTSRRGWRVHAPRASQASPDPRWRGHCARGMNAGMPESRDATSSRDVEAMRARGYVVIEGFLSAAELQAIRDALASHLGREQFGRNPFEGLRTQRVYN